MENNRGLRASWGLLLVAGLGLAAWLRLQQIEGQWLIDDEWHALHRILSGESWHELLFAVGVADFSVPQTLFYKLLGRFFVVDELLLRLPVLLCGLALVLGGGWWMARTLRPARTGQLEAVLFTAMLACAPMLVYQSRNARPYAITLLLGWLALWALARWRERETQAVPQYAWLYLGAAVLACWFHAAVAPFVLFPLLYLWLSDLRAGWQQGSWRALQRTTLLGCGLALGVGVLTLWPAWLNRAQMATRTGMDLPTLDTLRGFAHLLGGHPSPALVAALLLPALWGGWLAWRLRLRLLAYAALGVAGIVLSILLTRPAWVQHPMTFSRYVLPAWPLVLACSALGLGDLARRLWAQRKRAARLLLPLLLVVPLLPLQAPTMQALWQVPNNLGLHSWFWFDFRPRHNVIREVFAELPRSPFWDQLAQHPPGSLRLAVAGHALESYTLADVLWQPVHRQQLIAAQRGGFCGQPPFAGEVSRLVAQAGHGLRLRNVIDLDDEAGLREQVDYVAFNRNLFPGRGLEVLEIEQCIERFRARYGAPVHEDEHLVVFVPGTSD